MKERFSFNFRKIGGMIYISHLDLLRLFGRAAQRAGLPVLLTQGYNPRLKIKLKRALKLGVASDNEEGEIVLAKKLAVAEIRKRWQEQLPQGIEIKDMRLEETKDI